MDNLRNVIKIFFHHMSAMEVLSGNTSYDNIEENSFMVLANTYMSQYSNNEIKNMLSFFESEFEWHHNKMRGRVSVSSPRGVNVFDALLLFADYVLVEENGTPVCRYEHLLRWREMIVIFDEDLFVTVFLAQKDLLEKYERRQFFWPPVIGHNNKELNRLMAKGVAENHFHLKGSSPTFHLSWISMMNDVLSPEFRKTFEKYDERRLSVKVTYRVKYAESSLYIAYLCAALIRLYLFVCVTDDFLSIGNDCIDIQCIIPYVTDESRLKEYRLEHGEDIKSNHGFVCLDDFEEMILPTGYRKLKQYIMGREVKRLLEDPQELLFYLPDIQNCIEVIKERYAAGQLDYTLCKNYLQTNPDRHLNELLCGERWFLYEIFRRIYGGDSEFTIHLNLFYAYLLIKENVRSELIQNNGNVGFNNFLLYQNRKEAFIDGTAFEAPYLGMAVRDTILNQHIHKLEARITPKDSAEAFMEGIERNDWYILEKVEEADRREFKKRFFYVCHFIKNEDDGIDADDGLRAECRHYKKRNEVRRQAEALFAFRDKYSEHAQRILGIDAASEEIGCRPEVFAQAFRYLKNRFVEYEDFLSGEIKKLPDLCITYHVGEDFLDVTDGLRAIDEAISFLNMRCGDRLGHALALGVDVDDWYESKAGRILISQMDYLDNLVWLYSKIRKFRIDDCEDTVRYIEKKYDEYFRIVYLNNMNDDYLNEIVQEAVQYYKERGIQNNYGSAACYFSINTYYDSWKLRGDNPEYFRRGYFRLENALKSDWDEYSVNKMFPENYRIRYNPEAAYLFHLYHYNTRVKAEGNKKKEIKVNPCVIKAVRKVQKRMQWVVGQKGIGIETNPSSNALIGTFKRYDKHPILNWYNKGLATSTMEVNSVPQIHVSINTDDQGVFATYIENEYAYLALALEKMRDESGNPRFSRTLIYEWLDNVRKMGLVQSFSEMQEVHEGQSTESRSIYIDTY